MFDEMKLKVLDQNTAKSKAIDLLMEYWDEEFRNGRFDEFPQFADKITLSDYSPSVICCIHTVGFWIREKFDFKGFSVKVAAAYKTHGFSDERVKGLVKGLD